MDPFRRPPTIGFTPTPDQNAWTFGGREPVMRVRPSDGLELFIEDAFAGRIRTIVAGARSSVGDGHYTVASGPARQRGTGNVKATASGHVAVVADTAIPVSWLHERMAELRRGRLGRHLPPERGGETERLDRWVVQELVTNAVLIHEAGRAGLLGEPEDVRRAPSDASAGRPALRPEVMARLVDRVTARVTIAEDEQRAYYQRNADLYRRPETRRVRYVIAASAAASLACLDALAIDSYDAGPQGPRLICLPSLHRGEFVGPVEDALFSAGVGEIVGPYELEQGWIVAKVEAITPAWVTPFEEARASIEAELVSVARDRAFDEWLAERRASLVVIEPAYEHPGHPIHGLPQHRH